MRLPPTKVKFGQVVCTKFMADGIKWKWACVSGKQRAFLWDRFASLYNFLLRASSGSIKRYLPLPRTLLHWPSTGFCLFAFPHCLPTPPCWGSNFQHMNCGETPRMVWPFYLGWYTHNSHKLPSVCRLGISTLPVLPPLVLCVNYAYCPTVSSYLQSKEATRLLVFDLISRSAWHSSHENDSLIKTIKFHGITGDIGVIPPSPCLSRNFMNNFHENQLVAKQQR